MDKKNKYPLMYIFLGGMLLLAVIAFINASNMQDFGVSVMYFNDPFDSWMDFFNPINHAGLADPYIDTDRIYPPICYCFYWLISRFVPRGLYTSSHIRRMKYLTGGAIAFTMYMVVTTYLFVNIMEKFIRLSAKEERLEVSRKREEQEKFIQKILIIFIMFSSPFIYQYERANIIFIALMLLITYLLLKDSDNKIAREISLICLALSACIKIYPAVFGLLLLKEKRWKESIRVVIYGLIFFFVPFAFMGGFDKISKFLEALLLSPDNSDPHEYGYGNKLNFTNTIMAVHTFFVNRGKISYADAQNKAHYMSLALTFGSAIMAYFSKEKWKTYALLTGIMVGFPAFSFMYCSVFICIPLVTFIMQKREKIRKMDIVYIITFLMIFGIHIYKTPKLFYMKDVKWPLYVTDLIQALGVFFLTLFVFADVLAVTVSEIRKKKDSDKLKKS
ncbi:Protein of unknown function [Oscillospiraceae bacterium]|nr:Protein of unknown function [Oscillospiraceae bacterium]